MNRYLIKLLFNLIVSILTVVSTDVHATYDQYAITNKTVEDVLFDTLNEFGYDSQNISIAYYDFNTHKHYYLNADTIMLGASTTKVGTAALYINLVNEGLLTMDTPIPYESHLFEEGSGNISNGPVQDSYLISDLIYEMLYYSDNTAWNLLTNYYYENFGDYQNDLLTLSGIEMINDEMYQFNHVNAKILEGILIKVASNNIYQPIVDIMLEAQDSWLLKTYVNENMATKYGSLDSYFHDIGIFYENNQPAYAIVIMTDGIGSGYENTQNNFFGTMNLRLNRLYYQHKLLASEN